MRLANRKALQRLARVVVAAVVVVPGLAAALQVRDDTNRTVTVERPAKRVISLAPHITEMLFAIGAGDRIVGTIQGSDYPPAARRIPKVGGVGGLDLERIVALRPDLVIAWDSGSPRAQVRRLAALGIPVFRSEPRRLATIAADMERLGRLVGRPARAERAAAAFRAGYRTLRRDYAGRTPVRVFFEIWNRPLLTVSGRHLISSVIGLCGGVNVFDDAVGLTPRVSVEAVLARAPQAIIASGVAGRRPAWLDDWRRWPTLPAVRLGNLDFIPADLINRPSPRILQGARRLCRELDAARRAVGGNRD
jgi:iron complex transport system substrate-binding protein